MTTPTPAGRHDDDFQEILAQTRHFVRTAVVPREQEILAEDRVPDDLRDQAKKMGLVRVRAFPQEWGGLGLNLTQDVELAMELGYTSLALRSMFGTNNGIAGQVLVGFGTDEQKARWLEAMASGEVVASFALTEPGAGSNPAGLAHQGDSRRCGLGDLRRRSASSPTRPSPICSSSSRGPGPPTTRARASPFSWFPPTHRASRSGAKDAKMGQEGAWTADVSFTDVRVAGRCAGRRQRGHRLSGGDDLVGTRPGPHRGARGRNALNERWTNPWRTRPPRRRAARRSGTSSWCRRCSPTSRPE